MNLKNTLNILFVCLTTLSFANNFDWVDQFTYQQGVVTEGHVIDNNGNTFITGYFRGTHDFNPGIGVFNLSSVGNTSNTYDIFIQKIDANGNFSWAKRIGGTTDDFGHKIAFDSNGDVLIAGYSEGTVDFNPGAGVFNLNSNSSGSNFVLKLTSSGNFVWAKINVQEFVYNIKKIKLDNNDNIYISGGLQNTRDFDPGPGTATLTSNSFTDIFIQKLDSNGDFIWAKSMIGNDSYDLLRDIAFDNNNNIYAVGEFTGTVDFNPNFLVNQLTSNGPKELFVQKLDPNGNYIWAKNIGGNSYEVISDIEIYHSKIYTTGYFQSTIDIDPGAGVQNMVSAGNYDAFFLKLELNGDFIWGKQITGPQTVSFSSLFLEEGKIISAGSLNGTVDFDPSANVENLTEIGIDDFCILELDTNGLFISANQVGSPGARISASSISKDDLGNRYIFGSFRGTVDFDYNSSTNSLTSSVTNHSDQFVVKYDAVIYCSTTVDTSLCEGQTFSFNNQILSTPGIYIDTLTSANCDSIVTLNLTFYGITGTDTQNVCDSLVWIDGLTYFTSNSIATFLLSNANGCDSTVTLNLTINTVDASISNNDNTLSANNNSAAYQWINCDGAPVQGETNQIFNPVINGDYALIVDNGTCIDTSNCVSITTVELNENNSNPIFSISPNPASNIISINYFGNSSKECVIKIIDLTGKIVLEESFQFSTTFSIEKLNSGAYFLTLENENNVFVEKIIIE